jgi:hypothetical protein
MQIRRVGRGLAYTFLVVFISAGCSKDVLKENSLKARSIIKNATSLLTVLSIEDIEKGGKKESTTVRHENAQAKKYLRSKENELNSCYEIIKGYLEKPNDKYDDALYVTAFINEMLYFLSGPAVDDRCFYIRIVKNRKNAKLSDWVLNEFFAPLKDDKAYLENWLDMDEKQKYETIYSTLMASSGECF